MLSHPHVLNIRKNKIINNDFIPATHLHSRACASASHNVDRDRSINSTQFFPHCPSMPRQQLQIMEKHNSHHHHRYRRELMFMETGFKENAHVTSSYLP